LAGLTPCQSISVSAGKMSLTALQPIRTVTLWD